MDAQMKRGFLEACVLAVLSRGESYGYQIIKDVPPSLGLTESTLYPLLKRLEGASCIAVRSAEHNGRLRKYYRITTEGRARVEAFIEEWNEVEAIYRFVREAAVGGAPVTVAPADVVPVAAAAPAAAGAPAAIALAAPSAAPAPATLTEAATTTAPATVPAAPATASPTKTPRTEGAAS